MSDYLQSLIHEGTVVMLLAGLVVVVAMYWVIKGASWPYAAKPILSKAEQVVYGRLRQAFPELVVLAQVSLSQAVRITTQGTSRGRWFGKVAAKSMDFVLCRPDFSIWAAVELDDKTHDVPQRRRLDGEKNRVLTAARIPLLRLRAGKVPTTPELRTLVERVVLKAAADRESAGAVPAPTLVRNRGRRR